MRHLTYTTPLLPGFSRQIPRRKPRIAQRKLAEEFALLQQKSFKQIGEVFEKFIPRKLLKKEASGAMSRNRLFSKENTFWAFFSQVLDADGGCMEVIRKLQSYASIKGIRYEAAKWLTMRRWLEANPDDESAREVRSKLASEPVRHAAYTREYLGWGVFALMPR